MKIIFILILIVSIQHLFGQEKPNIICSDCISIPELLSVPKPEFPEEAKLSGISGNVKVQVSIDEQGNVIEAKLIEGDKIFEQNAIKAAMFAKFKPAKYFATGESAKFFGEIHFNFISNEKEETEKDDSIPFGILNEKAFVLPMPQLSVAQPCGEGKIEVKVKINLQTGEVVSAMAVSGHPLIRAAAVKAALQAKFPTTLTEFPNVFGQGFLIYKFVDFNGKTIENKTPKKFVIIEKGVVNDRAKNLPKPYFSPDIRATGLVEVKVVIDMNGKVVLAKAISGHPLLKPFAESAARETKFAPTNIGEPLYVKASLLYKFNSDHTVKTNLTDKDLSSLNQKQSQITISHRKINTHAVLLVKPEYPKSASFVRASGSVGVEVVIDENGNVESAEAVSGHPLLRPAAVKAALDSKFQPTYLSGKRVKVRDYIVYNFVP